MLEKRKENRLGKKRINKILIILIVLIFILSAFNIISYLRTYSLILDKEVVYAKIIISDRYGFDVNSTALTFGKIAPGGSSSIKTTIKNDFNYPVKIEISSQGSISIFLKVSDNNFFLKKGEEKTIVFVAYATAETKPGFYDGNVTIITKKKAFFNF
ncbi:hypothetical protein FJZ19_04310 [Candidatus Pacearchaeota archaeon]|nr:hypothetical protein [Candidatus Pacearchaeota archaeon]